MAQKTLTTSYLARLSNANHDGVTQQIDDRFAAFETDNTMFLNAATAVHAARQAEDIAFKRFSGKDFASDDLKREDRLEDQYMSTIRAMLNASAQYKWKRLVLRLELDNLLNQRHYAYTIFNGINTYTYDYTLCGRTVLLRATFKL